MPLRVIVVMDSGMVELDNDIKTVFVRRTPGLYVPSLPSELHIKDVIFDDVPRLQHNTSVSNKNLIFLLDNTQCKGKCKRRELGQ